MTNTKTTTTAPTTRKALKPLATRQVEARARAKDRKVRVYVVEPGHCYATKSQSEDDVVYHVTREREGWQCECPGYHYTGCCKHIAQVERRAEREGWTFGKIARRTYDDDVQAEITAILTGGR